MSEIERKKRRDDYSSRAFGGAELEDALGAVLMGFVSRKPLPPSHAVFLSRAHQMTRTGTSWGFMSTDWAQCGLGKCNTRSHLHLEPQGSEESREAPPGSATPDGRWPGPSSGPLGTSLTNVRDPHSKCLSSSFPSD